MKLKSITKCSPLAANLKNCVNVCSIHFIMYMHFYLAVVRHFRNYIVVHFLTLFWRPSGLAP